MPLSTATQTIPKLSSTRLKYRPWWRILFETALAMILAVAFLETYFSVCGIGQQEFLQPDLTFGTVHISAKTVTWRLEGFSSDPLSDAGLRDTHHDLVKPAGTYRIALLGDSATEGMQVKMQEVYGKVLERKLNSAMAAGRLQPVSAAVKHFEVINFGCSGYSTGQQLLQYEKQVEFYHPDAVVLMYNRGDSIENVIDPSKRATTEPRPYFFLDEKGNLQQDRSLIDDNLDKLKPNPVLDFLRTHSRIYGVFSQMNMSLSLNESRYRKLRMWLSELTAPKANPTESVARASKGYATQTGLTVTLGILAQLKAETKAHGESFYLVMFPNWIDDPNLTAQEAVIEPFAKTLNIDYLNLTPAFKSSDNLQANFLEYHFSPRGHELVAQKLFELFVQKLSH
jgi:lysophospholipase L1-like esterase